MLKFILGSMFYLLAAMSAFAGPGYYEVYTSDCTPAGMARAMDTVSAANRAVITVVKCDASASRVAANAPRMVRHVRPVRPVVIEPVFYVTDLDCDCDM